MKHLYAFIVALMTATAAGAQTELTTTEAKTLYKTTTKKRVSVHDPSVVWEPNKQRYYIFGSHRAQAWTADLQNWNTFNSPWKAGSNNNAPNDVAFVTPAVKKVKKGGVEVDFPQFNAMEWAARTDASYNINGNMWAPDVIYNPTMQKWCQYLSINGDQWHSSIILLTSDNIEGPYLYQGPVVISGFDNGSHSFKDTDVELVLDTLTTLPSRYNSPWAHTSKPSMPNNIDPCVFFDEMGKLWLAYGSWSGGIFMLELDEETGLRDYDVTYSTSNGDPYFGKRIAGGYYVSGEGAYIEHIGDYYYLFMSYGYLSQAGGYEMRVFRSKNPDGPYTDGASRSAVFSRYEMNYGPNAAARGEKVMGPYSDWGFMAQGERAQGHNSIIAAPDGRTYLVYHTRFCNANKTPNEGHQVRVHQVFQNKNGWLVVAPFEYNGETVTDQEIATTQPFTKEQLVGTYQLLIHKFANDYENLEQVTPITITLGDNNRITGDKTGSWSMQEGTGYITLNIGGVAYNGVVFEETMDEKSMHAISITAASNSGIAMWAYKWHPKYELAWQLNNQKMPVTNNATIKKDVDLYGGIDLGLNHVTAQWTSSMPEVISDYGKYCPYAISENTEVTLTARLETTGYFWEQDYSVNAVCAANAEPSTDTWKDGLVAHYGFDDEALSNSCNTQQTAQLMSSGTTAKPSLMDNEPLRIGDVVHLKAGAKGKESYVSMPNPLQDKALEDGVTLAFWVKLTSDAPEATLMGFVNGQETYVVTGDSYVTAGNWHHVVVTLSRNATAGMKLYVDGTAKNTSRTDCSTTIDLMAACTTFFLGKGAAQGSPDACFDDVMVYDRALSAIEVIALNQMACRAYDFATMMPTTGMVKGEGLRVKGEGLMVKGEGRIDQGLYDLQGRKMNYSPSTIHHPLSTIKIQNGKKILVR